jgi:hypothetical protein
MSDIYSAPFTTGGAHMADRSKKQIRALFVIEF